jgi:MFS family permease
MDARDRWLYGWGVGYAAVGGASLLVPLYALELGGGPALVGLLAAAAAFAGVPGALLWSRLAERADRRRRPARHAGRLLRHVHRGGRGRSPRRGTRVGAGLGRRRRMTRLVAPGAVTGCTAAKPGERQSRP